MKQQPNGGIDYSHSPGIGIPAWMVTGANSMYSARGQAVSWGAALLLRQQCREDFKQYNANNLLSHKGLDIHATLVEISLQAIH